MCVTLLSSLALRELTVDDKGSSPDCTDAAFFNPNDNFVQVACETDNVSRNRLLQTGRT